MSIFQLQAKLDGEADSKPKQELAALLKDVSDDTFPALPNQQRAALRQSVERYLASLPVPAAPEPEVNVAERSTRALLLDLRLRLRASPPPAPSPPPPSQTRHSGWVFAGLASLLAGGALGLRQIVRRGREAGMARWKKLLIALGISAVGGMVLNESLKTEQVRRRLGGITAATRDTFEGVLNGSLEQEVAKAANRDNLPPEEYHRRLLFTPPAQPRPNTEKPGEHRMRVSLVPGERARPLVVLIGGNDERLYDPNPNDSPNLVFGSRYLFEQLAARGDCHVIQLIPGSEISRNPRLNNAVAREHVRTIIADATRGQGMFKNAFCSEVRFVGYSYGAGIVEEVIKPGENVVPPDLPIGYTVYIEGVRFRSVPPVALHQPPERSGRHLQILQKNVRRDAGFASGAALAAPRPQDQQLDVSSQIEDVGHIALTGAHRDDVRQAVYQPVLEWLNR